MCLSVWKEIKSCSSGCAVLLSSPEAASRAGVLVSLQCLGTGALVRLQMVRACSLWSGESPPACCIFVPATLNLGVCLWLGYGGDLAPRFTSFGDPEFPVM